MSRSYRNKTGALLTLLKDKGFYIVLSLSLLMVVFAAFIALSWDDSPENSGADRIIYAEPLDPDYVPNWPEEEVSDNVSVTQEGITVDVPLESEIEEIETVSLPLKFYVPVNDEDIVSVNEYSGSMPVFSETLEDWRLHTGIDYITDEPCDVFASADGIVEDVYEDGFMGTTVLILHNDGTRTVYQSLSPNVRVVKGMEIFSGEIIGKTGESAENELLEGCHLHFEMIKDGANVEPTFE